MVVRDPVHGDIPLTEAEAEALDTPEIQRLRGIKQTGTAYLVYPGCVHTRFDHSLGTMFLAHRISRCLSDAGWRLSSDEEQVIALAALIHDVTHVPFGHTLEDERHLFPRHDQGLRLNWLLSGELGRVLQRQGYYEQVKAILEHKGASGQAGAGKEEVEPWQAQIISSTIDADLLDYLRRDSYFAGLIHNYDDRLFQYFVIEDRSLAINLVRSGIERPDARSEVLHILRTRYFLTERVYFHHTKVCSGAMIAKAVEMAQEHGLREEDLLWLDDFSLIRMLMAFPPRAPDRRISRLAERVLSRRLLKRGYVVSPATVPLESRHDFVKRFHLDPAQRRATEAELARRLGLPFEDVIIYCPGLSLMKEAAVLVRTPAGVVRLNDPAYSAPRELRVLEDQYQALWRLYVFVPTGYEHRCSAIAAEVLGFPSEHETER